MKVAESAYHTTYLNDVAEVTESSALRLAHFMTKFNATFQQIVGRMMKPLNPMLGETYEMVTPSFRSLAETVSHHPPIFCNCVQGKNYKIEHTS